MWRNGCWLSCFSRPFSCFFQPKSAPCRRLVQHLLEPHPRPLAGPPDELLLPDTERREDVGQHCKGGDHHGRAMPVFGKPDCRRDAAACDAKPCCGPFMNLMRGLRGEGRETSLATSAVLTPSLPCLRVWLSRSPSCLFESTEEVRFPPPIIPSRSQPFHSGLIAVATLVRLFRPGYAPFLHQQQPPCPRDLERVLDRRPRATGQRRNDLEVRLTPLPGDIGGRRPSEPRACHAAARLIDDEHLASLLELEAGALAFALKGDKRGRR
jgi:hypothetical protein